jgi:hypothetical protein
LIASIPNRKETLLDKPSPKSFPGLGGWKHPDFKAQDYDPDTSASASCMTRPDGVHLCPAGVTFFGIWQGSHVLLSLEAGRSGLFVAFTPEGARTMAAHLLEIADMAEQRVAGEVASKLADIAKGSGA